MFPVRYFLYAPLALCLLNVVARVAVVFYDAYRDVLDEQRRQASRIEYCERDHGLWDHFVEECDRAARIVDESVVVRTLGLFAERSKSCVTFECADAVDAVLNSWLFIAVSVLTVAFLLYAVASGLPNLFVAAGRYRDSSGARKCRSIRLEEAEENEHLVFGRFPANLDRLGENARETDRLLEAIRLDEMHREDLLANVQSLRQRRRKQTLAN